MANDIKIDSMGASVAPNKLQATPISRQAEQPKEEGVTVTNHLSKLVKLLSADEYAPDENARVMATKSLVEKGQYKVDVNALSEKLLNSGLLATGD
ncbi:MAG: flagellar biosynthesis anti-sigma factor FlgM [Gammaproteobacteria bacterium]